MPRPSLSTHYKTLLHNWPKDLLRNPKIAFQTLLESRSKSLSNPSPSSNLDTHQELLKINALYSLLENRYASRYSLGSKVMEPQSNPTYYLELQKQIERAPETGWLKDKWNRWTGMFRMR